MKTPFLSLLIVAITLTSSPISSDHPDLTRLFSGITKCDLFITRNPIRTSDLSFNLFLPATLYAFWMKDSYKIVFDIAQFRAPPCRIMYAADSLSLRWGLFEALQQQKYRTSDGLRNILSRENVFPLYFLNDKIEWSDKLWQTRIHMSGLEFLEELKIVEAGNLEICRVVSAFTTVQTEPGSCSALSDKVTVLEILQNGRSPPRKFFTKGKHLGLLKEHKNSDIAALKLSSNPMNRREKVQSVHLYHIVTVFSKSNSSLIFHPWSFSVRTKFRFNLEEDGFNGRFGGPELKQELLIITDVGGYSFLTCYSESGLTFAFYITPFQLELWAALLASFVSLTLTLSLWLYAKRIKTSFCCWLFVLGAHLEDGVPLPEQLEAKSVLRGVCGVWLIIGVLFSNCYNGLMITGLNSLLESSSMNTFKDLVCNYQQVKYSYVEYEALRLNYTHYSSKIFGYNDFLNSLKTIGVKDDPTKKMFFTKNCFSLLSVPHGTPISEFISFLRSVYLQYGIDSVPFLKAEGKIPFQKRYELELNLMHPDQRLTPQNTTNLDKVSGPEWVGRVEEQVLECGKNCTCASYQISPCRNPIFG